MMAALGKVGRLRSISGGLPFCEFLSTRPDLGEAECWTEKECDAALFPFDLADQLARKIPHGFAPTVGLDDQQQRERIKRHAPGALADTMRAVRDYPRLAPEKVYAETCRRLGERD